MRIDHAVVCQLCLGVLLLEPLGSGAAAPAFPAYRDLAVYTTSVADQTNSARIIASSQFVNRGKQTLEISARLPPAPALGFLGAEYSTRLRPGKTAVWTWEFSPPDGVTREVLAGEIAFNGRPERDLFLAVLGTDPAGLDGTHIETIAERARVVATYAPRRRGSVLAQLARQQAEQPKPALTLAAAGKTEYAIRVDTLPAPPEGGDPMAYWRTLTTLTGPQRDLVGALDDLQRVVRIKTDAALPIRTRADGPAVILRQADPGRAAKGLHDAYRLRTTGGNIVIEAATLEGLRNGVYGLLTDHLDCHWFMPGQLGEEIGIPADHAARLPALDEVRGSKWLSAVGSLRNRALVNRGRMNFGHAWFNYINVNEYPYEKFPQYYARDRAGNIRKVLNPGGSFTGFCSTEPAVIDIVARKVNAYFAANPEAVVASLDPNDYCPLCLCDRCLALDKKYGQTKEDGTEVADRLLHFSKEIYDRLEPRFKDRYLGILVYGFQMAPPISAKAHPHHVGLICDMFWTYDHTRPWNDPTSTRNRVFQQQLSAWGRVLSQFGYYEYTGNAEFFGPWALVHKIREDLPAFYEVGGTFLVPEAQPLYATQGLNLYISDWLTWDLDADVDLLLEEYFTRFYGPVAEPMRAYWQAVERCYALERPGSRPDRRIFARPEVWTELDSYLQQAGRLAAALPPEQKRFADRVQFARDGLEYGRLLAQYQWDYEHKKVDHAAALAFLRQYGPRIAEIAKKYPTGDAYWPPLAPGWALQGEYDVDRLLAMHQKALNLPAGAH